MKLSNPGPRVTRNASQSLLLAFDARGSVLADYLPGQQERSCYTPYGTRIASRRVQSRTGFNGQYCEPQGWYHLGNGHRLYNPVLRRFNRPDHLSPFGKGGINAYAYCQGDPVNFTDPTGRAVSRFLLNLVTPVLYDRPTANLFLTFGLLVLNMGTAFNASPVGAAAIFAHFTGLGGAFIGMTGATIQIAGEKEAGRWVSIVGTSLSGISVASKALVSAEKIWSNFPEYMKNGKQRLLAIVMPWKYKVVPPVAATSAPAPLLSSPRVSTSIATTSPPVTPGSSGRVPRPSQALEMREIPTTSNQVRQPSLRDATDDDFEMTYL